MKSVACLSACALAVLCGCSSTPVADARLLRIAPVERTEHSMNRVDALYQTGRYYQGQIRYGEAIAAYQQLLLANPDHVDAHNALAVIYANLGQYEQAESHFKEALSSAVDAGYLYNNLGYTYLLQGRDAEALAALEKAKSLSPDNERVAVNLSVAAFRVGEQMAVAQSLISSAPDGQRESPAGERSLPHEADSPPQFGEAGSAVDSLRASSSIQKVTLGNSRLVRLEVANGNGIRGMARQTARWLSSQGFPAARLTNQKPYRQSVTEIQYASGLEHEAIRLSTTLPGHAVLVEAGSLQRGVQVRVVIGRDLGGEQSRMLARAGPIQLAQREAASVLRP